MIVFFINSINIQILCHLMSFQIFKIGHKPHSSIGETIREMDKLRYQIASSLMSQINGS